MSIQDIEQATLEFIRDIYKKEYIGRLEVEKINPIGYIVSLYPQGYYVPTVIYAELEDDKFLKYLRDEIRNRKFHFHWYGQLDKREPNLCYPINKSCNDKR